MAEQKKKEEVKEPYRHVPTHAAIDAISCAPPTWRVDDRNRILEQNRRRSAMSAVGMGMTGPGMFATGAANHPGMIRASSSLSHVSYPSVYANPVVSSMPRSYSYSGGVHATGGAGPSSRGMYHQPWLGRQSVMHVPMPVDETDAPPSPRGGMGTSSKLSSSKGKEVERVHTDDSGVTSQASSKRLFSHTPVLWSQLSLTAYFRKLARRKPVWIQQFRGRA